MSFRCTYCAADHPEEARAVEHIVPQRLGNRKFIHRNTCARMNSAFAQAVEAPFQRESAIDSILMTLDPPKARDLGRLRTEDGAEQDVFLYNGRVVHGDKPHYSHVATIPLRVSQPDGTEAQYDLALPFEVLRAAGGSAALLTPEVIERKRASAELSINQYLDRVWADPTIDPAFTRFRLKYGIKKPVLTSRIVKDGLTPVEPSKAVFIRSHTVDIEVAFRYFIRIALLFASEMRPALISASSDIELLRSFLSHVLVEPTTACAYEGACLPFFMSANAAGSPVFWWALPVDRTEVAINTALDLDSDQRRSLLHENLRRAVRVDSVRHLVQLLALGTEGAQFHAEPRKWASHELALCGNMEHFDSRVTGCDIKLFGGMFHARIRLSSSTDTTQGDFHKSIRTRWYDAAT